ncbi:hypothetical protein H2248_010140 [Termitomyces sp. 'cryptogamus']|nr:hypothetical protein H2248_010140 [Termitomyces sp. 'cryptogamus']
MENERASISNAVSDCSPLVDPEEGDDGRAHLVIGRQEVHGVGSGAGWVRMFSEHMSVVGWSTAVGGAGQHAFLQGGLTITKQCNQFKCDIVKALQCLKCAIQYDLLFREPGPLSIYEAELEKLKNDENNGGPGTEEGWDELLSNDKDNLDMGIDLDSDQEEICHVCVIVLL